MTFDVVVDPSAMNGLIIENQGFVSASGAGSGLQPEQPSDDPTTPIPDDPTRNVVGNLPLLYAHKTVQIHEDFGSPGIVDPGDVLRYTIVISNFGAIPATGVTLTDAVPANTSYVADSLRLNGSSLGPDGGVSPLIAGLTVHSSDNPGAGIISAGSSAVITFDARVNAGVPTGTLISNQGSVTSNELPPEPTDADGLPSNGDQPTVIVVGDAQLLSVTKEVAVVGGGAATAGGQLEYTIRVTNIGSLPATRVVVTDDLSPPLGNQVTYVAGSGTLNGSAAGVTYAGSTAYRGLCRPVRRSAAGRQRRRAFPRADRPRAGHRDDHYQYRCRPLERSGADRLGQRIARRGRHAGQRASSTATYGTTPTWTRSATPPPRHCWRAGRWRFIATVSWSPRC